MEPCTGTCIQLPSNWCTGVHTGVSCFEQVDLGTAAANTGLFRCSSTQRASKVLAQGGFRVGLGLV